MYTKKAIKAKEYERVNVPEMEKLHVIRVVLFFL